MKQAWNDFYERELPRFKMEYPNLKRSQYIQMIQKEFKTSPDNPVYVSNMQKAKKKEEEGYIASYVAISPIEDTQVVLLLTLHKPTGGEYQGGQIAGPVVGQMLSEILPHLGVPSDAVTATNSENLITVPDVRNKTVAEAKKIMNNVNL